MPTTSIYNTILTSTQAAIQGLSLSGIPNAQVVVRKLPSAEETLDTLPLVCVAPRDEPEEVEPAGFENSEFIGYWVDVVVISAGSRDLVTGLDVELGWRESLRRAFQQGTLSGATTVWRAEVHPLAPIDRELMNENYDYNGLSVKFISIEPRHN